VAKKLTLEGMQMMGGYGYATGYDMESHVRRALASTIYGGTNDIQREVIARTYGCDRCRSGRASSNHQRGRRKRRGARMRQAVICEPLRTPVGGFVGGFRDVPAARRAAAVIRELVSRTAIPPEQVDEVLLGQCYPNGEEPAIGRVAALDAGLPVEVLACSSEHFSDREIVEVLQLIGFYWGLGRLCTVLDLEIETATDLSSVNAVANLSGGR
jgi:alkylhydroperoxidase family enzyme